MTRFLHLSTIKRASVAAKVEGPLKIVPSQNTYCSRRRSLVRRRVESARHESSRVENNRGITTKWNSGTIGGGLL